MLLQPATAVAAEPEAAPEFVVAKLVVAGSEVSLRLRQPVKVRVVYSPQRLLVLVPVLLREVVMDRVPPLDLELKLVGCYSLCSKLCSIIYIVVSVTYRLTAVCFVYCHGILNEFLSLSDSKFEVIDAEMITRVIHSEHGQACYFLLCFYWRENTYYCHCVKKCHNPRCSPRNRDHSNFYPKICDFFPPNHKRAFLNFFNTHT